MNATELTFGIEIEATIPAGLIDVGPHGSGRPIAQLPGWKADRDPSIAAGPGRQACEFVSPVYRGSEGLAQLVADIRAIKAMGAEVNASCGLHVHVGFDRSNRVALERLTTLVSNFETAVYASTGTKNRERGRWCESIRRHGAAATALQQSQWNRYHVVNLGSEHPTVEFRPFAASLNPQKIVGYVCMCLAMVERATAAKRSTDWTPKPTAETSPIHRSGAGQTQLTRFFYAMGWTKGRQSHVFGNVIEPAGGDDAARARLRPLKRELMRMARKYDAQP